MVERQQQTESPVEGMTLVDHLAELRRRIIIIIGTFLLGAIVGFYFSPPSSSI